MRIHVKISNEIFQAKEVLRRCSMLGKPPKYDLLLYFFYSLSTIIHVCHLDPHIIRVVFSQ